MKITLTAYAKLNPVLSVLGIQNDRHRLDTVILPIAFGDTVEVATRTDDKIVCTFQNCGAIAGNTAEKMAQLLQKQYGLCGVEIQIVKRIPEGAGLGGSSADAAAVARAMQQLFDIKDIPPQLLSQVGSDVYAQYLAVPTRLTGTGAEAVPLVGFPMLYAYILTGGASSYTSKVFQTYDQLGGDTGSVDKYISDIMQGQTPVLFNALERAANVASGAQARKLLQDAGLTSVAMSGSGSAYAGYLLKPLTEACYLRLQRESNAAGLTLLAVQTIKG